MLNTLAPETVQILVKQESCCSCHATTTTASGGDITTKQLAMSYDGMLRYGMVTNSEKHASRPTLEKRPSRVENSLGLDLELTEERRFLLLRLELSVTGPPQNNRTSAGELSRQPSTSGKHSPVVGRSVDKLQADLLQVSPRGVNLEGNTEGKGPLEGTGDTSLDHDKVLVDDTAVKGRSTRLDQ